MSTPDSVPHQKSVNHKMVSFLAAGLGTGWIKIMPGTWGSLLGLGLTYFIGASVLVIALLGILALVITHLFEKQQGGHDHSSTVIDEVAGMNWCFFALPLSLPILLAGFVVFRVLDIAKPFPLSWIDRTWPGALGTVCDDLAAGIATCGVLHLAVHWGWL